MVESLAVMLRIGELELGSNLLLAPIAGYCDLAFRRVVRSVTGRYPLADPPQPLPPGMAEPGVGLACTDLLCPQAVLRESDKAMWLAATCPEDQPVCMQLYGRHPHVMAEAARWAEAHGAKVVDINMGCPVDKVTKKNGGSKLLCEPQVAVDIVRAVVRAVNVPVTCKIRLGWDDRSLITRSLPPRLADEGIAAITVHGRTTEQLFRPSVRLAGIAEVVEALTPWPDVRVIGNGDVSCPEDARRMLDATGCDGVMIGRAALGAPWIFRDTAWYLATGTKPLAVPRPERARLVLEHFRLLRHYRGDRIAVTTLRQRMARYSAALQPWPHLRREVRQIDDADAFEDFFEAGIDRIATEDCEPTAA